MPREISAGIIIYRKTVEGIKYLLLYHGGNYWNFPKGKLEQSERGMDAAFREVQEETGLGKNDLVLRDQFRVTNKFFFFRDKKRIFKVVIFYLAQSKKLEVTISQEHNGYGWFVYRHGVKMLKDKSVQDILSKANNLLTKGTDKKIL